MTSAELRQKYLKFFQDKGHKIIPSASLIPPEEVELAGTERVLFTTAGMHPLIPYLLGKDHPEGKRLVNVQKCLRTDDIDEVGDTTHNTFFEMLGNWSLGDYGKEEAINWSYEFLINVLKLDAKRIYVSVFAGDNDASFDEESYETWKKLGVGVDHIFKYGKEDNWWPTGGDKPGPQGPDTEMFYDMDPKSKTPINPAGNNQRFVEIWNDVFMQYQNNNGSYTELKQKNVDTGMGLERILTILQGKDNIYETELFSEAIELIKSKATNFDLRKAKIIADHARASTFLISDGIKPRSADERGSILVRLLTKSMALGKEIGINGSFISTLSDLFVNIYKNQYKELDENRNLINNVITQEETQYAQRSLTWMPIQEQAITNVINQYKNEQQRQQFIAGQASIVSGASLSYNDLHKKFPTINSNPTASEVIGTVSATLKMSQGIPVEETFQQAQQVYSTFNKQEAETIVDVMKNLHSEASKVNVKRAKGGLAVQSDLAAKYHTATHLLHQALRDILGNHVHQTGSHITDERLRFDFSHDTKLTREQIKKVEDIVNKKIEENLTVSKKSMPKEAADQMGAIGLFHEKYGDLVNIYCIGKSDDPKSAYSKEFCGGPHADSTGSLGSFKITKEESTGASGRRIYATIK